MNDDLAARERINDALDSTMVVVAGAGTGKTTVLVNRIVELVRTGRARLKEIAAITFTEAAAAELRQRIREALEQAAQSGGSDPLVQSALGEVDDAAISTLHSFAQRMLIEHSASAGLTSGFEVLDDTADVCDFEARWSRFADELFEDPGIEPALVKGFVTGLRHTDLRAIAKALHDQWDRFEDRLVSLVELRTSTLEAPSVDTTVLVEQIETALALAGSCTDEADNLLVHLHSVVAGARDVLARAAGNEDETLHALHNLVPLRCTYGRQENWDGRISEIREACASAEEERTRILTGVRRAVLGALVPRLMAFVLEASEERRAEGRLNFHDLLVHARRLLRSGGEPLESLRRRYKRILVDEFQDTDPIQIELTGRLVARTAGSADLATSRPGALFVVGDPKQSIYRFRRADIGLFERVGDEIGDRVVLNTNFRSVPGVLDFVNSVFCELFGSPPAPGQAEHHPLLASRDPIGPSAGDEVPALRGARTAVRRRTRGAAEFQHPDQMQLWASETADHPAPTELPVPLAPGRAGQSDAHVISSSVDAPVVVVGARLEGSAADIRRQSARDVAQGITQAVVNGWPVGDRSTDGATHEQASARAGKKVGTARYANVAVLIPTRTSLPSLEEAFEDAGVPYRLEGASMLWGSEEVRDVLSVLRAVDDPADEISMVAALRSPGLACGDDDLLTWHEAGGQWDLRADPPGGHELHPVAGALQVLRGLHGERWWCDPSALVARACDVLRSFDLAFARRRPRDHWARLRWLCDQARMFDENTGGSLRAFLSWAELQADGYGGAAGVGPPDPDDDAVRIMTIHGSKGLEFPVVFLCGLERQEADGRQPPTALWNDDGSVEVRAGPQFCTAGYEEADARDQELDNLEKIRLLYVAMTRARDHLVVCVNHRGKNGNGDSSLAARLFDLCEERTDLWRKLPDEHVPIEPTHLDEHNLGDFETDAQEWRAFRLQWASRREQMLAELRRRPVVSATALSEEPGSHYTRGPDRPPDGDAAYMRDPGERVDRDLALNIGRAVHEVMSAVDLASGLDVTGRGLEETSRARAISHGIEPHAETVARLSGVALRSDVVHRASSRRHWRELYAAVPVENSARATSPGTGVLEGFVDLLYEDDDGLVVVDYKTDRLESSIVSAEALARYEIQVGAYCTAVEKSTGREVRRCVLLFVGGDRPVEHVLEGPNLEAARLGALEKAVAALWGSFPQQEAG